MCEFELHDKNTFLHVSIKDDEGEDLAVRSTRRTRTWGGANKDPPPPSLSSPPSPPTPSVRCNGAEFYALAFDGEDDATAEAGTRTDTALEEEEVGDEKQEKREDETRKAEGFEAQMQTEDENVWGNAVASNANHASLSDDDIKETSAGSTCDFPKWDAVCP
eukprot:TRINITY_DN20986_c0_g1_i2.p2 TRINITY_DN20986_c0_g1~~TRINITY_DN20986_c0_g1_i2.p2  ORF type:complete len:162 (-),score=36.26 TRINITY_DN20986_c0_g1_i2:84-569(-)